MTLESWKKEEETLALFKMLREEQDRTMVEAMQSVNLSHPNPCQAAALQVEYQRGRYELAHEILNAEEEEDE